MPVGRQRRLAPGATKSGDEIELWGGKQACGMCEMDQPAGGDRFTYAFVLPLHTAVFSSTVVCVVTCSAAAVALLSALLQRCLPIRTCVVSSSFLRSFASRPPAAITNKYRYTYTCTPRYSSTCCGVLPSTATQQESRCCCVFSLTFYVHQMRSITW